MSVNVAHTFTFSHTHTVLPAHHRHSEEGLAFYGLFAQYLTSSAAAIT